MGGVPRRPGVHRPARDRRPRARASRPGSPTRSGCWPTSSRTAARPRRSACAACCAASTSGSPRELPAMVVSEPEFCVLRVGDDARSSTTRRSAAWPTRPACAPTRRPRAPHPRALDAFGLGVTTALREFSPGQFEINLAPPNALEAADNGSCSRRSSRSSRPRGPDRDIHGEAADRLGGLDHHVHASLWRDERTLRRRPRGSAEARSFAAGLIAHAEGLTALAAPTINSYKRLGNGELCPSTATPRRRQPAGLLRDRRSAAKARESSCASATRPPIPTC